MTVPAGIIVPADSHQVSTVEDVEVIILGEMDQGQLALLERLVERPLERQGPSQAIVG